MTPSPARRSSTLLQLALLVAAGLVLFLFESFIPRPLPWLKPGLANIATLFALYTFGVRGALLVTLLRVILGSMVVGSFLNPAFLLSIGGGLCATLAMAAALRFGETFSVLGVSAIGAFCHNAAQIFLAYFFIVRHTELFLLLPIVLLSSLFTGFVVGLITHLLLERRKYILV
jgi:heptaprenyl diphosphate synthase